MKRYITFKFTDGSVIQFEEWKLNKACHHVRHLGYTKKNILKISIEYRKG